MVRPLNRVDMTSFLTIARWIVTVASLVLAALCLLTTLGAFVSNWLAHRKREREGTPHKGAGSVSGLTFMAFLSGLPAAIFSPNRELRIAALVIMAVDLLYFVSGFLWVRFRT